MKGCMLIHGFTGSPREIKPLADYFREHTEWKVYTPTLAGHGNEHSLEETTWQDWIRSAEQALQTAVRECDEVYLIGFSMGGLIAGHLSSRYPVSKLILLSPAVYAPHTQQLVRELSGVAKGFFNEEAYARQSLQRYRKKWTSTPIKAVVNFRRLVRQLKPSLKDIRVPLLIIHGEKDHVAHPKGAKYLYQCVQSSEKELLLLKDSKHIVCHDCEREILFEKVSQFLNATTKEPMLEPEH